MKKIFVYLLVGVLTTSVVFSNYYKSAHAMEWVSGALSFSEVLTWLLASVGITCTITDYASEIDKSRDEFWEEYEQKFYEDVELHYGVDTNDIKFKNWVKKLCEGVLDKSSEYWTYFKEWASSLVSGSSSVASGYTVTSIFNQLMSQSGKTGTLDLNGYGNMSFVAAKGSWYNYTNSVGFYLFSVPGTYTINKPDSSHYHLQLDGVDFSGEYYVLNYSNGVYTLNKASSGFNPNLGYASGSGAYNWALNIGNWTLPNSLNISLVPDGGAVSGDTNFDSVTDNINDLDVISSDGVDEDNPEVTLPYPGVSDSDDTASADAYDEIIDAINDGTITQEQGVEKIQEILRIITYDTVTDKVIPPQVDPDTGEDKTKDDVLKENKNNMGFTLAGLENVFPFCIPFDIYAFMTLLVADPEAPEIDFPIKSVNGEVEEIHIDLSPFDSVAVVVRYIFDFLFIIGLGILTRSLIGGGSSD